MNKQNILNTLNIEDIDSIELSKELEENLEKEIEESELDKDEIEEVYPELLIGDDLSDMFEESEAFDNNENLDNEDDYHKKDYYIPIPKNNFLSNDEAEILAKENMPLVQYVVKKFKNIPIEHDELVSVGLVGFTKAIKKFNPQKKTKSGKNIKFSTFAYRCIENEIFYFIRTDKKAKEQTVSLNTTLSTDKNGNELELDSVLSTENNGDLSLEETVLNSEVIEIMKKVINENLTAKEKLIITHRFGIGASIKTQNELAQMVNMSQANISKLEKNILDKIKKIMMTKYQIKNISF